ncbi:hypothetical protein [Streptomyces turgidiscabies]|uniref:hypothetical protein n=1 Tax=Streptomyces turgidiscabies TaxID=85558 RepID=UPI0027D7DA9A|nr:hypothetical protein [Streptomyces turgidiscabies]
MVFTAGALISASSNSAFADMLEDVPLSGAENTDQDGEQNLACGNSARLVRLNVGQEVHREQVCVDDDGHTSRDSAHAGAAQAVGGTTLGPQVNTAQRGRQNLACGNSADLITVNVAGTMSWDTTCTAADYGDQYGSGGDDYPGGASARGGTTVGPQVNTAQAGWQNVYCGNSADALTVNVAGTIRRHTTCAATDYSAHGSGEAYRGRVSADAGQVIGPETNTAQNGRQNQACGNSGAGIDIPLGRSERQTRCTVHDGV